MPDKVIMLGDIPVGIGMAPIILPDIDVFFNQDIDLAKEMIISLVGNGSKFIKAAVIHDPNIVLDDDTQELYYDHIAKRFVSERYRDLIERKVVPLDSYRILADLTHKLNAYLVLSVYDREGADFAVSAGAVALKIASSNITHKYLIDHVCDLGVPIIVDTGKASLEEISRAIGWIRAKDALSRIVIQHSPLAPPHDLKFHHLNMMKTLGEIFDVPFGLSDHHAGNEMMIAATALGACVLEKGVCPQNAGVDQDVAHAVPVNEFPTLLTECRNVFHALGTGMRFLDDIPVRRLDRMGLIAKVDLRVGSKISEKEVGFAWPPKGVGAEHWSEVEGYRLTRAVKSGHPINWSDIEAEDKTPRE
jgi:sialic acid synthase SpsE